MAFYGTKPGDVFSFAIVMHEVFYQTKPYGLPGTPPEEILERVRNHEVPAFRPQVRFNVDLHTYLTAPRLVLAKRCSACVRGYTDKSMDREPGPPSDLQGAERTGSSYGPGKVS